MCAVTLFCGFCFLSRLAFVRAWAADACVSAAYKRDGRRPRQVSRAPAGYRGTFCVDRATKHVLLMIRVRVSERVSE